MLSILDVNVNQLLNLGVDPVVSTLPLVISVIHILLAQALKKHRTFYSLDLCTYLNLLNPYEKSNLLGWVGIPSAFNCILLGID